MADVCLEHITKRYDGDPVVADISLRIRDGEFFVLVGPSGCGKSTILRMIAGLETPTGGTVLINGRAVNALPPGRRNVSMVFQNYALFPHMSVRDNIAFGMKVRRTPAPERTARVAEAASLLGLGKHLDKRPGMLSGGQRQRVALGRAIVRHPDVFLFDEPLSNLDARLRTDMRAELLALHRRLSTTMLYVTHDQVEAMTLGDRVCVINEGRIRQLDTPSRVYERPADVFTASFIGSPPMNVLPARLGGSAEMPVALVGGTAALPLAPERVRGVWRPDAPVSVGVRPTALEPGGTDPPFAGTVKVVERVGERCLVHAAVAGHPFTASIERTALEPGDACAFSAVPGAVTLFGENGKNCTVYDD